MDAKDANVDAGPLLEFLFRLGQAYLASGEQTAEVERILRRVASANGARRPRVVAFPTALFLSVHDGTSERVTLAEGPTQGLRLDQIAEVYSLGDQAQRGEIPPPVGLKKIEEIWKKPARFGMAGSVAGHTILSVGLAMVLMPSYTNLVAAFVLGAIVGALKTLNRDRPMLSIPLPVVAAALVSTLVFSVVKRGVPVDPLHALIPPLVTFLPGARLTLGMVELAYGDMVSGSSRLMAGFVQLLLLAFGLTVGAVLVGYGAENLVDAAEMPLAYTATHWTAWVGVSVFALGVFLHFSAPRGSLRWTLPVMLVAFATQQFSARIFGQTSSGFFGMLVVTPLAYLIQLRFKGPPAMVTFLPSFWILVPGALSLLSVKYILSDRNAGLDGMITAIFAIVSIALGTLIGASLYKWLSESFGKWLVQFGKARRFFRRNAKK